MKRLILVLILTGCSSGGGGHATPPPTPASMLKPIPQPAPRPVAFAGHIPVPGETLKPGRTDVLLIDQNGQPMLIAYLVYDGELFDEPRAAGDTGVVSMRAVDAGGTQNWRAIGDLQWIIKALFGDGVPWRVHGLGEL